MFCEKCGAKNKKGAKFCEKCGAKMNVEEEKKGEETKTNESLKETKETVKKGAGKLKEKVSKVSKKTKICVLAVVVLVIVLIVVLSILLNNPTKKVENYLTKYYDNYSEKYDGDELVEIGKILKSNKEKNEKLDSISKQARKTIDNWVKNFNTSYKDKEDLDASYEKITGILEEIYDYYNGLKYMLDSETYYNYKEDLYNLYASKYNYLNALSYEEDNYQRYYYAQKVVESDSYYKEAQEIVSKFVKDEITSLKENVEAKITLTETSTEEEKYKNYLEAIEYLNDNKYSNNLDLSNSEEYKTLKNDYISKMVEALKNHTTALVDSGEVKKAVSAINDALEELDSSSDVYQELSDLKTKYNDKLPVSLTKMYEASAYDSGISATSYSKEIDDVDYDGAISYRFHGENSEITYRTNKEYTRFRAKIIIGKNWDKDFKVNLVILGDDKELYRLDSITKDTNITDNIDLDITGVDDITIKFESTSGESYSFGGSRYLYLVEPYLYK